MKRAVEDQVQKKNVTGIILDLLETRRLAQRSGEHCQCFVDKGQEVVSTKGK
ncbi:MAG: hypothetical protein IPN36_06935 [Bacteroidetes bacterium]|nr:hypothetical protein [Bacteroidota bacterium]